MKPIFPFNFPLGFTITIWTIIGIMRYLSEKYQDSRLRRFINKETVIFEEGKKQIHKTTDIAVIIPAHNEEIGIPRTIKALKANLKANQIYVVSDGSTDKTYQYARREGVHVSNIKNGIGKAKAMKYLIKKHKLFKRYKFIFIVDADTQIDKTFVPRALKNYFCDPDVGAVFAAAKIKWPQKGHPSRAYYYISYRERLTQILQHFYMYGQSWKPTNANYVVPGFAVIYRSDILKQLEIDTPGLLIEDFNLAFQIHKKKLCKVGFHPEELIAWDQHPDNLVDYWKQVRRWNIGFFQTVRKQGFWPSFFWLMLILFTIEVFMMSFFILFLPLIIFIEAVPMFFPTNELLMSVSNWWESIGYFGHLTLFSIFVYFILIDYLYSVIFGMIKTRPQYYYYGFVYIFMHYITSLILVSSFIPGFFGNSDGKWTSPKRF
jgi:poly-beta-1,6-N-acetyl-D-glucosamine synthase